MSAPREDGCIGEGEEASHVFAELNQHDKIHWFWKNVSTKERI